MPSIRFAATKTEIRNLATELSPYVAVFVPCMMNAPCTSQG